MIDTAFFAQDLLPALNRGLMVSLALIIPASLIGFAGGIALGCARAFGPPWLRRLGNAYTALLRGVPLAVQLMMIYYALPKLGIYFEPYGAALTSFILCTSAYQSEYVRGALLSIRQGQIRAAQALGFTTFQTILWIVVPQAARRALPSCGNEIVYLIKYSSLAYLVTCMELMGEGKVVASDTFRFTEVFLAVGLYYLAMVTVASWILHRLEERYRIPGFGNR
ncbi:MAG: amino acid ABC transporter permease [Desulfovibrio sp.]|jgi:polar amino acid transport system permease protein|nr:amino acid ABC transporter permease [Desulfovibrio sp.]MCR5563640.1 amino acid ABC transporter permease [Desulfovibrio sp.]